MYTPYTPMFRPCCFDPSKSLFAGMTTAQLQAALDAAQAAYVRLMTGGQGVSFSYTQGDGTRSVTYTAANPAMLAAFIRQLQQQLGIICRGRAPVRFWYR
ncbi:gpW family protein [Paraburkholderia adhaesiva]|uniref:gpW family protein n=1 Tax=Paraburkholderia adhaesiva TaxID=2883244 RepID=UPI001F178AC1|nr:gpW family protein [Paraburkholderia adhaesiva]